MYATPSMRNTTLCLLIKVYKDKWMTNSKGLILIDDIPAGNKVYVPKTVYSHAKVVSSYICTCKLWLFSWIPLVLPAATWLCLINIGPNSSRATRPADWPGQILPATLDLQNVHVCPRHKKRLFNDWLGWFDVTQHRQLQLARAWHTTQLNLLASS